MWRTIWISWAIEIMEDQTHLLVLYCVIPFMCHFSRFMWFLLWFLNVRSYFPEMAAKLSALMHVLLELYHSCIWNSLICPCENGWAYDSLVGNKMQKVWWCMILEGSIIKSDATSELLTRILILKGFTSRINHPIALRVSCWKDIQTVSHTKNILWGMRL